MNKLFVLCCLALTLLVGCASQPARPPDVHLNVVVKKYAVEPAEIRLKHGQIVMLHVSTADVQHGFDVPSLGISESIQPGKPAIITFEANLRGRHRIECGIICGAGHDDMTGLIIIE